MTTSAKAGGCVLHDARVEGTKHARSANILTATVVVYGDSLTFQSRDGLVRAGYGFDAYWGRRTKPTVDRLAVDLKNRKAPPRVIVMAVGTNDTADPSGIAYQVRRVRALAPTARIIWMNVYKERAPEASQAVNRQLSNSGAARIEHINWYQTNLAYGGQTSVKSSLVDAWGFHLTCQGARARNYSITHKVSA